MGLWLSLRRRFGEGFPSIVYDPGKADDQSEYDEGPEPHRNRVVISKTR